MNVDELIVRDKSIIHNSNNKIRINITNLDNKISISTNLFFIKMKLIVHNINLSNLIDYIINIIIVKKYINYIKVNMLIEKNIHFLFYKKNLKINCKSSLLKISY